MADFGITAEGFKRKKLDQLLNELNDAVKAIFGENFNVSPESPDGQINGVVSESNANLWELAEEAYNAFNPSVASGDVLSNLVQLNGITRLPATPSRALLDITGTSSTIIPEGSLVSTSDSGLQYATESDVEISGGVAQVFASAVETGPNISLAGTITIIDTPITGWDSVTNASDAIEGTDVETDVELRARRSASVARDAQAIIDAIFAEVSSVPGVTQVTVLENDTDVTDLDGNPPHSFQVIVTGGDDDEIAQAIWLKKPAGIQAFGSTLVDVPDSQGIEHSIGFSRPTPVDIYVDITVNIIGDYPATGDADIAQAIIDYADGVLVPGRGFNVGDDVIFTELYTPINSVPGHEIVSLFIDTTPSPVATANIPISVTEISNFTLANITVTS